MQVKRQPLAEVERDESLAAALWAVITPRVARCGASCSELGQRLRAGTQPPSPAELRSAARETEALGWLLGCVAEGLDSALFTQRRAAEGLTWLLEALREACAARGSSLSLDLAESTQAAELSRAESWACAEVLWLASARSAGPLECRVVRCAEGWSLDCSGPLDAAVGERATLWSGEAPRVRGAGWQWVIACARARSSGA